MKLYYESCRWCKLVETTEIPERYLKDARIAPTTERPSLQSGDRRSRDKPRKGERDKDY